MRKAIVATMLAALIAPPAFANDQQGTWSRYDWSDHYSILCVQGGHIVASVERVNNLAEYLVRGEVKRFTFQHVNGGSSGNIVVGAGTTCTVRKLS